MRVCDHVGAAGRDAEERGGKAFELNRAFVSRSGNSEGLGVLAIEDMESLLLNGGRDDFLQGAVDGFCRATAVGAVEHRDSSGMMVLDVEG